MLESRGAKEVMAETEGMPKISPSQSMLPTTARSFFPLRPATEATAVPEARAEEAARAAPVEGGVTERVAMIAISDLETVAVAAVAAVAAGEVEGETEVVAETAGTAETGALLF